MLIYAIWLEGYLLKFVIDSYGAWKGCCESSNPSPFVNHPSYMTQNTVYIYIYIYIERERESERGSNLVIFFFLLRCGTRSHEWGTQWDTKLTIKGFLV